MKTSFGIIFIIIGLLMIGLGLVTLTNLATKNQTIEAQLDYAFSERAKEKSIEQKYIGLGLVFSGVVIFIVGIVMTSSKSSEQKQKDIELSILKSINYTKISTSNQKIFDDLAKQAHKFYHKKDYFSTLGILKRMLELNPNDSTTFFNLACCYSLIENIEGISVLSKAIENGYTNIENINTFKALEWLREQPEFSEFKQNGFKISSLNNEQKTVANTINFSD